MYPDIFSKQARCDNVNGLILGGTGCSSAEPTYTLTIIYDDADRDVLNLCENCTEAICRDARAHGYTIRRRED